MRTLLMVTMALLLMAPSAHAVSSGVDVATTIKLRGYDCGGRSASNVSETRDGQGNQVITASCPNGKRYRIVVTPQGRLSVQPLN